MSGFGLPSHLLLLHKPLADNLVDSGLDEAGRDGLAVPPAVRIVRDRGKVGGHVTQSLSCRAVAKELTAEDILAIAAYLTSLSP
jgi:hypothetical protein